MFTLTAVLALTEPAVALPVTVPCPRFTHWAPSQPTTTKLSKDKLGSTLVLLQCKVMVTLGLLPVVAVTGWVTPASSQYWLVLITVSVLCLAVPKAVVGLA